MGKLIDEIGAANKRSFVRAIPAVALFLVAPRESSKEAREFALAVIGLWWVSSPLLGVAANATWQPIRRAFFRWVWSIKHEGGCNG